MNSDSCLNRGFRAWLAGVLIPFGVALAGVAQANQVFTTDCDFGLTDYFPSNQAVCATGDVDTVPPASSTSSPRAAFASSPRAV